MKRSVFAATLLGGVLLAADPAAELFGKDPVRNRFVPKDIFPEEIELFRKCAAKAVKRVPAGQAVN